MTLEEVCHAEHMLYRVCTASLLLLVAAAISACASPAAPSGTTTTAALADEPPIAAADESPTTAAPTTTSPDAREVTLTDLYDNEVAQAGAAQSGPAGPSHAARRAPGGQARVL